MDPNWEYDAPQFVDFNNIGNEEDNADEFFDVDENGVRLSSGFNSETGVNIAEEEERNESDQHGGEEEQGDNPTAGDQMAADRPGDNNEEVLAPVRRKPKPSNMVTSWGKAAPVKVYSNQGPAASHPTGRSHSQPGGANAGQAGASTSQGRPAGETTGRFQPVVARTSSTSSQNLPPAHRGRARTKPETPTRRSLREAVAKTVEAVRNSPRLDKNKPKRLGTNNTTPRLGISPLVGGRSTSGIQTSLNKPSARSVSKSPGRQMARPTSASRGGVALPKTPDILKRSRNKLMAGNQANRQMGLGKIRTAMMTKRQVGNKTAAEGGVGQQPVRAGAGAAGTSHQPMRATTRPVEFKFATDSRVKPSPAKAGSAPAEAAGGQPQDFSRSLRSYRKPETTSVMGVTQTKPFPSMERKRRHSADPNSSNKYTSMAEQLTKFQQGTPDRFRSRPRAPSKSPTRSTRGRSASPNPGLTMPKTPHLATMTRSRPATALSREQQEEKDMEEAREKQFRAHAVGENVPKLHYRPVERRPPTVPQPFQLTAPSRPDHGAASRPDSEDAPPTFHAKPLPHKILESVTGLPEKRLLPVVSPQSPAFVARERTAAAARQQAAAEAVEPVPEPIPKAKPAPHRGVPVCLPTNTKKSTVPQPFSFSERDQVQQQKKEEKIKKILEEEAAAREFHAHPIAAAPPLPPRQPVVPTKPEPFQLKIEERVESRLEKWQEDITKELNEQRKAANFKASEATVLEKNPFKPKPSDKPLSEIGNFTLHSEKRAEERSQYDKERQQKEAEMEGEKRLLEERRKREEEEEVNRMRKQQVHKAQPIRHYRPVEVAPSEKPLTHPQSPRFRLKDGHSD